MKKLILNSLMMGFPILTSLSFISCNERKQFYNVLNIKVFLKLIKLNQIIMIFMKKYLKKIMFYSNLVIMKD